MLRIIKFCWVKLSTAEQENYWVLLRKTVNCWVMLKIAEHYWVLLSKTEYCWARKLLSNTKNCWVLLRKTKNCWEILKIAEHYWACWTKRAKRAIFKASEASLENRSNQFSLSTAVQRRWKNENPFTNTREMSLQSFAFLAFFLHPSPSSRPTTTSAVQPCKDRSRIVGLLQKNSFSENFPLQ